MSVQKPSRELSIEEILTWTFELYSKNFVMFLIPILITALISGSLTAILTNYIERMPFPGSGASQEELLNWFWSYIATLLTMGFILGTVSWVIGTIMNGVCIKYASELIEKGMASLGEAFNFTVYKLLSLLAAALITGILIGLGFLALIVPGIIIVIMFYLVVPVIVIEDAEALESLSRSRRLVSSRWFKTFILALIVCITIFFVSFIGALIGGPFGDFSWLVSSVIAAFVEPIFPISMTVYYYSMVGREAQRRVPRPQPPPF